MQREEVYQTKAYFAAQVSVRLLSPTLTPMNLVGRYELRVSRRVGVGRQTAKDAVTDWLVTDYFATDIEFWSADVDDLFTIIVQFNRPMELE